jgi:hypothetical protein
VGAYATTGEIPAAIAALRRGDTTPLLRLGAESDFNELGDDRPSTEFSLGAFAATP